MARNTRSESTVVMEELGRAYRSTITATIDYDIEPAEPQTREYPGCPGGIELTGYKATKYTNSETTITRDERPDWFTWLDKIVEHQAALQSERLEEQFANELSDYDDDNNRYDEWRDRRDFGDDE